MISKLPTKLLKGPLVDAAFEIRFETAIPLSTILPGHLYSQWGGASIERMPHADIPEQIRNSDPNLQYAPLVRLKIEKFVISVSDRSVQISCRYPYSGWPLFEEQIIKTLNTINAINLVGPVARYSLKYTDVLPSELMQNTSDYLNAQIAIGGRGIDIAKINLQTEILESEAINLLQIVGRVDAQILETGEPKSGLLIDIDSIRQLESISLSDFIKIAKENLTSLHAVNKKIFFDCLSERGLKTLEPEYD
ncbi:TIGR04255 family protein [Pseudomonas paraglycinae]|uniref:TIGR04255 family protein n=1 Tax=Pseudomonas paraglycinae TaxID=2892330 RepID=UPI003FD2E2BD